MRLIVDLCCNPLGLAYGNHDINVEPVSESLRELFWGYLHGETHTCLLCRLKLLQELWLSDPDRCDPPIIGIVREAEETINRMESDLVRINKSADDEDSPLR